MLKNKREFLGLIRDDMQRKQLIRAQWNTIFTLLELEKCPDSQQIEMEKAFYLGAGRCLELVIQTSGNCPDKLEQLIQSIQAEIKGKFVVIDESSPS